MDKPADLATSFTEVYQWFLDDLVLHGRKPSTMSVDGSGLRRFLSLAR